MCLVNGLYFECMKNSLYSIPPKINSHENEQRANALLPRKYTHGQQHMKRNSTPWAMKDLQVKVTERVIHIQWHGCNEMTDNLKRQKN